MDVLHALFFFLVAIVVLVAVHEAGHFLVARWLGVHVVRFSVGFGKRIAAWQDKRGTEFCISILPLGGFVRLYDRRDADADAHAPSQPLPTPFAIETLTAQPPANGIVSMDVLKPGWRIAIALGGPAANLVLAFVLYWLVAMIGVTVAVPKVAVAPDSDAYRAGIRNGEEIVAIDGEPTGTWPRVAMALVARLGDTGSIAIDTMDANGTKRQRSIPIEEWHSTTTDPDPLTSLGLGPAHAAVVPAEVEKLMAGERAEAGGMQAGDRVSHVDGEPVVLWSEFAGWVRASPERPLRLTVLRAGETLALTITPASKLDDSGNEYGFVGATAVAPVRPPDSIRQLRSGPVAAIGQAAADTWRYSALTVNLIGKMLTLSVSPKNVAGPITIAQASSDFARAGLVEFLMLLALLSINLGIINLLPIPVLDGGVVVLNAIEAVRRKPAAVWAEAATARVGIAMMAALLVLVFYADIARWFWPGL